MTFTELEKICSLLWGQSWQSELARTLDVDRRTVNSWKRQGVAKWVNDEMQNIIENRKDDVHFADEIFRDLK